MTRPEDATAARPTPGGASDYQAIAKFLRDGRLFHQTDATAQRVQLALYRLIAEGAPVTLDRLARAVALGGPEAREILDAIPPSNFQRDEADRFLGFRGLGQLPTRHCLTLAGREPAGPKLYAWCAFDCLFLPVLLGGALEAASSCPVTQADIRLTVSPKGVEDRTPESLVMSFVTPEAARLRDDLRGTFCCHVNFFASQGAAEPWRVDNRGAAVLSLDEGFELGRIRNQAGFGRSLAQDRI